MEDGAGLRSSAFWVTPQSSRDYLGALRKAWTSRLCQDRLCLRLAKHLQSAPDGPPLSPQELHPFLEDLCDFLQVPADDRAHFLAIAPGQPFRLNALERLLICTEDSEACICPLLRDGVRLGVDHEIRPSDHWPIKKLDPVLSDLTVCEGSWQSASSNPDVVRDLLAQELEAGWIREHRSLQELHDTFPAVAVGKLGLVLSEHRSPRLVVDSSISGVTAASKIPNHIMHPRISDVAQCAPLSLGADDWITVSFDIRKAHRQIKLARDDQALLAFNFEGRIFTSLTLNFGARASSFWWSRVAGALQRLSHHAIWVAHLLFAYVDDYLGGFSAQTAPISAGLWAVLLMCLNVPMSWNKTAWGGACVWIGWHISFASWTCELPPERVSRILEQLTELLSAGSKVRFKTLESLLGRLLWVTGLWRILRPLLAPLYKTLWSLPASCVAVSHELWAVICRNMDDHCVLQRSVGHQSFHREARITRVANTPVDSKLQALAVPFLKRRLWIEVRDPEHPLRALSDESRGALLAWKSLLAHTSFVRSLRARLPLSLVAEADACADASTCGLGGYVTWPSGRSTWFAMSLTTQDLGAISPLFPQPLQAHIAALELLSQLMLLWMIHVTLPSCRGFFRVQLRCDNAAAESSSSKGLSSVTALAGVLSCFLVFQEFSGLDAEVEHIPGYRNALADELSRLSPQDVAPLASRDQVFPPLASLLRHGIRLEPSDAPWPAHLRALLKRPTGP